MSVKPKALAGIRVLDLSRVLAGPTAGQFFGDFGAEVIKVEKPGGGDDARRMGGSPMKDRNGKASEFAPMYLSSNRNKKSIAIDLSQPDGQDLVRQLAAWADVLIENYKSGDLKRYGLDYETLRKVNRKLVYCSITGFGHSGPYAARAGFDPIFQAMSGLMSVTGQPDGTPGAGPVRMGVPIVDFIAGCLAYGGILTALHYRDHVSGEGQHIDLALLDAAIAASTIASVNYLSNGVVVGRQGNGAMGSAPSGVFECADGQVLLSCPTNDIFQRLCKALQCPEIAVDPRFKDNLDRVKHRAEVFDALQVYFKRRKRMELIEVMEGHTVPCAPIYNTKEVFDDPQVQHRGDSVEIPHPVTGKMRLGTNPIHMSATPVTDYTAPPGVGEHTIHVLTDILKLDAQRIDELRSKKVV